MNCLLNHTILLLKILKFLFLKHKYRLVATFLPNWSCSLGIWRKIGNISQRITLVCLVPFSGQIKFQLVTKNGYILGPYTLWALNSILSWPVILVGTAMASLASGVETHQAWAMLMMSPQGLRGSPYRPRPECSMEEKAKTASKMSKVLLGKRSLNSLGRINWWFGYSLMKKPYSRVTIFFGSLSWNENLFIV